MSKRKRVENTTTLQIRLHPTPEQVVVLKVHCKEYIAVVNVLASALDADLLPEDASTKDFACPLPSAVKNQALRDAHSVFNRSLELGVLPVLKKPVAQWNNQNWQLTDRTLTLPVWMGGKTQQTCIPCDGMVYSGKPGMLRIKQKRGKWIADIAFTLPQCTPVASETVMGVDLGIKVPAVSYTVGYGARFYGNGRYQRFMRRRFYARRKSMQKAKKTRAVRKSKGKEERWMKEINHQLSRQIVKQAQAQGVGIIRVEVLSGIRERTTRTRRGAKARKNNRMHNTWSFYQLTEFITYKAERMGIRVEAVDPAYTSQDCPACKARNKAKDRFYICLECGWVGHRDKVGAINISRKACSSDKRKSATGV